MLGRRTARIEKIISSEIVGRLGVRAPRPSFLVSRGARPATHGGSRAPALPAGGLFAPAGWASSSSSEWRVEGGIEEEAPGLPLGGPDAPQRRALPSAAARRARRAAVQDEGPELRVPHAPEAGIGPLLQIRGKTLQLGHGDAQSTHVERVARAS